MSLFDWAGLAAVTFGAAVLQAAGGFGFAVLATPLFLLFVEPEHAVQLVIVVSSVLSIVVLPHMWRSIAPRLLLRLAGGSLLGLPLGLVAFGHSDPRLVRLAAGVIVLGFAAVIAAMRRGGRGSRRRTFAMTRGRDLTAGAVSGAATALVGMSGPPVLIYLMLVEAPPRTIRATLLAFFALIYSATLAAHAATIGIPARTWVTAGILIPFALTGGFVGRPLGDRLGADAFAILAIGLLGAAGLYTFAAAAFAGGRP
jgi:uncharacterized protein